MIRMLLSLLAGALAATSVNAAETIGLSLPLDGRLAPVAKRMEYGAQLAVQKLTQQGHDVQLVLVDDGCDVDKATETATTLIDNKVDIVVGPLCFRMATAMAKHFKQATSSIAPMPIIAVNTRNKLLQRLREVDGLSLFSLSNAPHSEARAVVDLILPRFQGRPFAILDDGSVYGRALADDIRDLGEQAGLRAVVNSNFRPLQTTQIAMLRRLRKSGVEAVFIASAAEDVVTITNDIRTLKYDWMVATGERGELLPYSVTADSNMAGMFMVRERKLASDELKQMIGDLASVGATAPDEQELEDSLLWGHALVEIGAEAARRGLTDLSGETFETIIGPLTFDAVGRASPAPFILLQWQDGAFETVQGN
jgi:branched-chain amino acid transport system substrate-binding protein